MTDFKAKMHPIRFRLRLRPRPRWGSLQRSPRLPSLIWGRFAAGGGAGLGKRRERRGKGEGGGVEGRERDGPQITVDPRPVRALLRHWYLSSLFWVQRHQKRMRSRLKSFTDGAKIIVQHGQLSAACQIAQPLRAGRPTWCAKLRWCITA